MVPDQAGIEMTPYILGIIMVLVFIVLGYRKITLKDIRNEWHDRRTVEAGPPSPQPTGNFKFVEENPEKFVLYAEYERYEGDPVSDVYKVAYWRQADTEDLNAFYDKWFLNNHGRTGRNSAFLFSS